MFLLETVLDIMIFMAAISLLWILIHEAAFRFGYASLVVGSIVILIFWTIEADDHYDQYKFNQMLQEIEEGAEQKELQACRQLADLANSDTADLMAYMGSACPRGLLSSVPSTVQ